MKAIACVTADGYLLPAHLTPREDKRRFAALTAGGHCIVGRKTFEELPKKMQEGSLARSYTVIASDGWREVEPIQRCDAATAVECHSMCKDDWLIGGNRAYSLFAEHCQWLYLSIVKVVQPMNYDVGKFPIDVTDAGRQDWDVLLHQDHGDHTFEILRRRP